MNGLGMRIEFERLLYTQNPEFLSSEKIDPEEIYAFLNKAERIFINEKYLYGKDAIENSEIIAANNSDLNKYISTASISLSAAESTESFVRSANLPNYFDAYINSTSNITRTDPFTITNKWVKNEFISNNEIGKYIDTTGYNSPLIMNPGIEIKSGKIYIRYDRFTTINSLSLKYLVVPNLISADIDCSLPDYLHNEIINKAVQLFVNYKYSLSKAKE